MLRFRVMIQSSKNAHQSSRVNHAGSTVNLIDSEAIIGLVCSGATYRTLATLEGSCQRSAGALLAPAGAGTWKVTYMLSVSSSNTAWSGWPSFNQLSATNPSHKTPSV